METRDSLCGLENLIDNISFEVNPNVNRACDVLLEADTKNVLCGWTSGFDKDNGYVLIFLPLFGFQGITDEEQNSLYEVIRKKFVEANFEILHEGDIDGNVYFHVGFASHNYILKSLV